MKAGPGELNLKSPSFGGKPPQVYKRGEKITEKSMTH